MNAFSLPQTSRTPAVVAIPAYNEADWITRCLMALSRQQNAALSGAMLLVNNSTDSTASIARNLQDTLLFPIEVIEHQFPPEYQTAGQARRMAMDRAADWVPAGGVLLCTDADGQVAPDWLAANLFHIRHGADAVAGRAVIDPVDAAAIPVILHQDDARECAYAALLDEIDSLLDAEAADPWPRHTEHSGASICVTLDAFRRAGGIPPVPVGEDRAFFSALRRIDARLRHASDVWVTVSGRVHGRAAGGMADTIRRRLIAPDMFLDDALEPAADRVRRARLRRRFRDLFAGQRQDTAQLLKELRCSATMLARALDQNTFGLAWEMVETHTVKLIRAPVPLSALPREAAQAMRILAALRADCLAPAGSQARWSDPNLMRLPLSRAAETSRMAG